jgi:Tol biopolymer transport system component
VGATVALISAERELSIWRDGRQTTVTAPGRISNVGWSPDGRYLAVSAFPPDWTEGAVSSARTTAEFLRMQNANLHLFDATRMAFVGQLTSDPGTEYGPFFSPDGRSLYYVWLHATEDLGGLMRLDLDRDDGTSASSPARQVTRAGNDPGEIPLGRVGTYLWRRSGAQLVFESGLPDGSGEIWAMAADGRGAARIAAGRKPQAAGDAGVVFLNGKGVPETVVPEVRP